MMVRYAAVSLAAVLMLGVAPALGQEHTPMADADIQRMVEHRLVEAGIRGVEVSVAAGDVTLTGTVPSLWARTEAVEQALEVSDVHNVVNELIVGGAESDETIASELARSVRSYVFYTIFDHVSGQVSNGVVTLTGKVTMPYKAKEIEELASRIPGVKEVQNNIEVLPTSISDEQLRGAIASRIYRDPMFWNHAIQINPPIHIIVEHGRVTLTGVVNSEVERRRAEIIARGMFGVLNVANELRVD